MSIKNKLLYYYSYIFVYNKINLCHKKEYIQKSENFKLSYAFLPLSITYFFVIDFLNSLDMDRIYQYYMTRI